MLGGKRPSRTASSRKKQKHSVGENENQGAKVFLDHESQLSFPSKLFPQGQKLRKSRYIRNKPALSFDSDLSSASTPLRLRFKMSTLSPIQSLEEVMEGFSLRSTAGKNSGISGDSRSARLAKGGPTHSDHSANGTGSIQYYTGCSGLMSPTASPSLSTEDFSNEGEVMGTKQNTKIKKRSRDISSGKFGDNSVVANHFAHQKENDGGTLLEARKTYISDGAEPLGGKFGPRTTNESHGTRVSCNGKSMKKNTHTGTFAPGKSVDGGDEIAADSNERKSGDQTSTPKNIYSPETGFDGNDIDSIDGEPLDDDTSMDYSPSLNESRKEIGKYWTENGGVSDSKTSNENKVDPSCDCSIVGEKLEQEPAIPVESFGTKHPYIGKQVRIIQGKFEGASGRILSIGSRGWWTIDHPDLINRKVHSRLCEMVDLVEESTLRRYYDHMGMKMSRLSSIMARQDQTEREDEGKRDRDDNGDGDVISINEEGVSFRTRTQTAKKQRPEQGRTNDEVYSSPSEMGSGTQLSRTKIQQGSEVLPISASFMSSDDSNHCRKSRQSKLPPPPPHSRYRQRRPHHIPMRPPALLNAKDETLLLTCLEHLPPDSKIDIFNRKTGRVLCGDEAVYAKDLPDLLGKHSEYEPVIPAPKSRAPTTHKNSSNNLLVREGRSASNVRVSETVNPQHRVRASAAEGKSVLVTAGPHEGLVGKIEACIPGGWYLVSGLLGWDELEIDLVISSDQLELLPASNAVVPPQRKMRVAKNLCPSSDQDGSLALPKVEDAATAFQQLFSHHFSNPVRVLKLRIDALTKEKSCIMAQLGREEVGGAIDIEGPKIEKTSMPPKLSNDLKASSSHGSDFARDDVQLVLGELIQKVEQRASNSIVSPDQAEAICRKKSCGSSLSRLQEQMKYVEVSIRDAQRDLDKCLESASAIQTQAIGFFGSLGGCLGS